MAASSPPTSPAGLAAAAGAAASATSRNVFVRGLDFMRPKVNIPFVFFFFVALAQVVDLYYNFLLLPFLLRLFFYFTVTFLAWSAFKVGFRTCLLLSSLSFGIPYLIERIPATAEFAFLAIILMLISTSWAWWLGLSQIYTGISEVFRWVLLITLAYLIIWPQFSLVSERFGLSNYTPNLDPRLGPQALKDGMKKTLETMKAFPAAINKGFDAQVELAAGDFYTGKVDKNVKEPLGVFIKEFSPTDQQYYDDEIPIFSATIGARTLDKTVELTPKCFADKERREQRQGLILPPKLYVDSYEQEIFNCRFDKPLKAGDHKITATATFSFETQAYLKTYFMDRDRIRSLRRENVDPLDFYKINDKAPSAIFTNGPVMIGMSAPEPPVGLKEGSDSFSFIGITLRNNWEGKIEALESLKIELPEGMIIDVSTPGTCTHSFKSEGTKDGYNVYSLDIDKERASDPSQFKEIDQFQTFRCIVSVKDVPKILGTSPISIKYWRANAEYLYTTFKDSSLEVKSRKERLGQGGYVPPEIGPDGKPIPPAPETEPEEPRQPSVHTDAVAAIMDFAKTYGVDEELALKVAMVEGTLQHYAASQYVPYGNCDGKVKCGDGGCSLGVMQINTCAHTQCIGEISYSRTGDFCRGSQSCAGTSVLDLNCNIEAGVRLLKTCYDEGQKNPRPGCYCDGKYTGWLYAAKCYNGCVCDNSYVEKVQGAEVSAFI